MLRKASPGGCTPGQLDARSISFHNHDEFHRAIGRLHKLPQDPVMVHPSTRHWCHPRLAGPYPHMVPMTLLKVGPGKLHEFMRVCTRLRSTKPFSLSVVGTDIVIPCTKLAAVTGMRYELYPFKAQGGLPLAAIPEVFHLVTTDPSQVVECHGELWRWHGTEMLTAMDDFILSNGNIKLHIKNHKVIG